jgi:glutathione S-transferase
MGLEIPQEFSLVSLVVVASWFVHVTMGTGVTKARKKYGVLYPTMYAVESENKEAKFFNCVQRGHQNFLETVPFFLALLLIAGLQVIFNLVTLCSC